VARLAQADAFRSLGLDRRAALWAAQGLDRGGAVERLALFDKAGALLDEPETDLPPMPLGEHVVHDYRALSLSLKAHPVALLRERFASSGAMPAADLERGASGRFVRVGGLVLVRQRPGSAKGVIFMTLEDETGVANVIVWKRSFERFRAAVLGGRLVEVGGRLQKQSGVIHVVAEKVVDRSAWLALLAAEGPAISGEARADEVKRPVSGSRGSGLQPAPRHGDAPLAASVRKAMPKGRNFH
jgi:error-prone DNA polymerase